MILSDQGSQGYLVDLSDLGTLDYQDYQDYLVDRLDLAILETPVGQ